MFQKKLEYFIDNFDKIEDIMRQLCDTYDKSENSSFSEESIQGGDQKIDQVLKSLKNSS